MAGARGRSSGSGQSAIERLLFRKVELWLLLVVAFTLIAAGVYFGHLLHTHLVDGTAPPRLGQRAAQVASLPSRFLTEIEHRRHGLLVEEQRFEEETGFDFFYEPDTRPEYGYLLLSRRDGDLRRSVVELVDLNAQQVRHRWVLEPEAWWREPDFAGWPEADQDRNRNHVFRAIHPLLLPDGRLVLKGGGGSLVAVDACARPLWMNHAASFHHATERDADGNIWIPAFLDLAQRRRLNARHNHEGFAAVAPDTGELIALFALERILFDNGLEYLLTGQGMARPYPLHLNDVQPVLQDGRVWKRDDLLLSLRDQSLVLLFRPASGKVIWHRFGGWQHQHDVDVLDDATLTVFDNNAYLFAGERRRPRVMGTNRLYRVRFPAGTAEPFMQTGFVWNEIRSGLEGLADWVTPDRLMVEETRHGRVVQMDEFGGLDWQFINRAKDGKVRYLNWSRHVPRELGEAAVARLREVHCGDRK